MNEHSNTEYSTLCTVLHATFFAMNNEQKYLAIFDTSVEMGLFFVGDVKL